MAALLTTTQFVDRVLVVLAMMADMAWVVLSTLPTPVARHLVSVMQHYVVTS